jgi:polysaccharide pyruvyl transferase WcaK-like protein
MKVVITHGGSDANKGDVAMMTATVGELRRLMPDVSIVHHVLGQDDIPGAADHSKAWRKLGLTIEEGLLPSPYVDLAAPTLARNVGAMLRLFRNWLCLKLMPVFPPLARLLRRQQARAYERLKEADIVIAKGGHYIYNDQGGLRAFLYIWRIFNIIGAPVKLGRPTVLLGISAGPIIGDAARRLGGKVLRGCAAVVVREKRSKEVLAEIGVADNVILAPDLAFLIEPRKPEVPAIFADHDQWIAVSVYNIPFADNDEVKSNYFATMVDALAAAHTRWNLRPVFFLQEDMRYHGVSDRELIGEMLDALRQRGIKGHLITEDFGPEELSWLYGLCRVALATRFHSVIFAQIVGTPCVSIEYQGYKSTGVMEDAGMGRFAHNIHDLDADRLIADIGAVLEDRDTYSKQVLSHAQAARARLRGDIEAIFKPIIDKAAAKAG